MTTMTEIEVRCAVCGALARKATLASTSSFGPPDLDLRPNGPARWALGLRVQRCESCGYCAPSIGEAPPAARAAVESVTYREVLERSKLPRVARSLFCAALVAEAAGRLESSAWRFLEAAWACDDKRAATQARICRERAAEMFATALAAGEAQPPDAVVHTLIAEIWRRAGRFDDALAACAAAEAELGTSFDSDDDDADDERSGTAAVVAYIRNLAIAGEDGLRSCADAFDREE